MKKMSLMPWVLLVVWLSMVIMSNRRVLGIIAMIYAGVRVA